MWYVLGLGCLIVVAIVVRRAMLRHHPLSQFELKDPEKEIENAKRTQKR